MTAVDGLAITTKRKEASSSGPEDGSGVSECIADRLVEVPDVHETARDLAQYVFRVKIVGLPCFRLFALN